jgi:hypothetical protein
MQLLKNRAQRQDARKQILNAVNKAVNESVRIAPGLFKLCDRCVYMVDMGRAEQGSVTVSVIATKVQFDDESPTVLMNKQLYGQYKYWGRIERLIGEQWTFVRETRIKEGRTIWSSNLLFQFDVPLPKAFIDRPIYRTFNDYITDKRS